MRRLLALGLILLASAAAAQPRQDLSAIEREQKIREQQRDQWRADAAQTRRDIDELAAQLAELAAAQARGETVVSERRLRLAALNVRETELATRAGRNQNQLARLLGALQMFSKSPPPALFVHPRDAKAAVRAAILIKAVTPDLERRARAFAAEAAEAKTVRRQAAAEAEDLFTAESDVADRAGRIERLLAEKQALERGLLAEATFAERDIAALAARAQALRAVVGRLPPAPREAQKASASLIAPVPGAPYRRFGQPEVSGTRSEGWTWRPAPGTAVAAPAAAVVEYAGPVNGWRNVVILGAGDGQHIVLAGLDLLTVKPGQSVAQGQQVARMVNGDNLSLGSASPELRLEIRKDGQPIDPARFLQIR